MRLYNELAEWWPILSPPFEYEEEAGIYLNLLRSACDEPIESLLELGSGGGHNASFLKKHVDTTVLVDLSPAMLEQSRALNPDCEHHQGDMRSVRLGRDFDAVFVHDAIMHMTHEADLRKVFETAYSHCRAGGAALFTPDHIADSFEPSTEHGGFDGETRSIRYLAWTWDPDPEDQTYRVDYAYLLRRQDGSMAIEQDHSIEGLFPEAVWLRLLDEVGFEARAVPIVHSSEDEPLTAFICRKPGNAK